MKICHIITTIDAGGAEKHLLTLVQGQVELSNDVSIIVLSGNNELHGDFSLLNVKLIDLRDKSFISQVLIIRNLVSSYDLIHAHLPRSEIAGFFGTFLSGKRFVITRHNTEPFLSGTSLVRFSSVISRFITNRALKVISISESVEDYLFARKELSSPSKSVVIKYGVRDLNERVLSGSLKSETSLKMLCVARLENQKDLPTLIRSVHILKSSQVDVTLDIFGSGSLESKLKQLISDFDLENIVFLKGKSINIESEMSNYDVLVLPSKYEGFGLVLLESMKNSLPIIASDAMTIREVLGSEYPGLFEVGNEILLAELLTRFFKDSKFRSTLNMYLAERKKLYSSVHMVFATSRVYSCHS